MKRETPKPDPVETQRLDKWLFFSRMTKSREKAQDLIRDGHVRLNGQRCQIPSQPLKCGDVLTLALEHQIRVLRVLAAGIRRGPPAEARSLYEEAAEPAAVKRQWP